jgi:hypothetical protein
VANTLDIVAEPAREEERCTLAQVAITLEPRSRPISTRSIRTALMPKSRFETVVQNVRRRKVRSSKGMAKAGASFSVLEFVNSPRSWVLNS